MRELVLQILIPAQIRSRSAGERFLNLFVQYFPDCLPERFGNVEPLKNRFHLTDLAPALKVWGAHSFIAERQNPRIYFMVNFWPAV